MSNKNKQPIIDVAQLNEGAQNLGVVLMTAAVTMGIATDHIGDKRVVLPNQPAFATAGEQNGNNNPLRREREESAPHYISYNNYQRTPARSGKH